MAQAGDRRSRLLEEARFLGTWAALLAGGVDEGRALGLLAEETQDGELLELARALRPLAGGDLEAGLGARATGLSSWAAALLLARPRRAEHLAAAAALLEREAKDGWSRGLVWAKLERLRAAGAPLGDGLAALAREARDHGRAHLGEALYAAARAARGGAGLLPALRAAAGLSGGERLLLDAAREDDPLATLAALEALGAWAYATPEAGPAPGPAATLSGLAQAAQAAQAPLRRGLDRLLSGIEGALGIPREDEERARLAREAVAARAASGRATRPGDGPTQAPSSPPAGPGPGAAAGRPSGEGPDVPAGSGAGTKTTGDGPGKVIGDAPGPKGIGDAPGKATGEPAATEDAGGKKTIGLDSGPVRTVGAASAGPREVSPDDRIDAALAATAGEREREALRVALDAARAKLTLLELHPEERELAEELEAELRRLRAGLPASEGRHGLHAVLDDLELRLVEARGRG